MKRKIALIIAISLCLAVISATSATQSTSVTQFEDIHSIVLNNNKNIKSNNLALEVIRKTPASGVIQDALFAQSNAISEVANLISLNTPSQLIYPTEEGELPTLNPLYPVYLGVSLSLNLTLADISKQIEDLNPLTEEELEANVEQFKQVENQIIWGAQSLYMAYINLSLQLEEMNLTLKSVEQTIEELEKRFELGQISELDVINAKSQVSALKSGISTMEFELTKLKMDINVILGRRFDEQLNLSQDISPDLKFFNESVFSKDLEKALENNYSYQTKLETIENSEDVLDIDDGSSAKANLEMSKLNAQIEADSIETSLTKLSLTISEKIRLLQVENDNLDIAQLNLDANLLKYELGMISLQELKTVENDYSVQQLKIKSANFALFIAIEQYRWAIDGMITG